MPDDFVLVRKARFMHGVRGKHYIRRKPRRWGPGQLAARLRFAAAASARFGSKSRTGEHPVREGVRQDMKGLQLRKRQAQVLQTVEVLRLVQEMKDKGLTEIQLPDWVKLPASVMKPVELVRGTGSPSPEQSPLVSPGS